MSYKAKEYARAVIESKKFSLKNFLHLLGKNGDRKKLGQIIVLAEKMMLAKHGNKKILIETARPLLKKIDFAKKGDVVEEKINPALVAGIKITVDGEKQLDISLKHILDDIL